MKAMRGVSKEWKRGFERSPLKLVIRLGSPAPQPGFSERFASLTFLDMGEVEAEAGAVEALAGLTLLRTLILGLEDQYDEELPIPLQPPQPPRLPQGILARQNFSLQHLKLMTSLADLNLGGCVELRPNQLACLVGLPIARLVLGPSKYFTAKAVVDTLKGLPLTHLQLQSCTQLTAAGLASLLRDLPHLVELSLAGCVKASDATLFALRTSGAQNGLTSLVLAGCGNITHLGLKHLQGLPLARLDLSLSGNHLFYGKTAFAALEGMPLAALFLEGCPWVDTAAIAQLQGLPLHVLSLARCSKLKGSDLGELEVRQSQSLFSLSWFYSAELCLLCVIGSTETEIRIL